ncbi:MAG: hypothetical protein H6684_09140 [Deltaproteobacteria bacterium]|nr:hypothetical protein [Deltaproteobacteria bacterium]
MAGLFTGNSTRAASERSTSVFRRAAVYAVARRFLTMVVAVLLVAWTGGPAHAIRPTNGDGWFGNGYDPEVDVYYSRQHGRLLPRLVRHRRRGRGAGRGHRR